MKKSSTLSYELTFILGETATEVEGTAKTKEITEQIKKLEGTVTKDEQWGRRELAYPIGKNRSGFYVTLWFDAPGAAVKPLEQSLRFDESVIRFLTTKAYTEAQPGSLYPVVEEEKPEKGSRKDKSEEAATTEEMLRRSSTKPSKKSDIEDITDEDLIPEDERLEKLDEALENLLKEEE
jgi:small subunit ribosomal protein S6